MIFVLWPWRLHELEFNSPHILSFTAESIIKLLGFSFGTFTTERCRSPDPRFSLNSCVSFLFLSPYRNFGNPVCRAGLDITPFGGGGAGAGRGETDRPTPPPPNKMLCCCCQVTSVMSDSVQPRRRQPTRLSCLSPGKNTGVCCHFLSNAWKWKVKVKSLSHAWLLVTPWTVAYQAPPSMGFSRQEYWSGVPLPSLNCFRNANQKDHGKSNPRTHNGQHHRST